MHIKLNLPVYNHPLAATAIHTAFIPGVFRFLRSESSPDINSVLQPLRSLIDSAPRLSMLNVGIVPIHLAPNHRMHGYTRTVAAS